MWQRDNPDWEPRWEFRAFAPARTLAAPDPLPDGWDGPCDGAPSRETYVLLADDALNLKLRAGALELKRRDAVRDGAEQWRPAGRLALPAAGAEVRALLAQAGIVLAPEDPRVAGGRDALALIVRAAGAAAVRVAKTRRKFACAGCLAERVTVSVAGRRFDGLAVEDRDLDAARRAARALGLLDRPNESYPAFLRRARAAAPGR